MKDSFFLLKFLKSKYNAGAKNKLWWPNSGTFEVVVGAILTQQSKWEKVEKSIKNLKNNDLLSLEMISKIPREALVNLIMPSSFYNTKAKNLQILCQNILEEFKDFEAFSQEVNKQWLLSQKGIGQETADSILCYALLREEMVVDRYTYRLVRHFGYNFEDYKDLQNWCKRGILENYDEVLDMYPKDTSLNEIYSRFHGKIVMFCKENMQGSKIRAGTLPCCLD